MNNPDFIEDPVDLANALNEDDDPIYSNHPIQIKSSLYYEFEEFLNINSSPQFFKNFSMLSFNIRSIHGKFEEFNNFLLDLPHKFSVICLQEVWSISRDYPLQGYQSLEYCTRDMHLPSHNCNCGGGVGIYIAEHLTYTILELPNSYVPGVFESIWIRVKINKNEQRIIGNIYIGPILTQKQVQTYLINI